MTFQQFFSKLKPVFQKFRRSRFIALWVAGLVLTLLVVVPAFSQPTVTLSFLIGAPERPTWEPIIKDFEATHPGIRLNFVEGPNATNAVEDLYTSSFLLGSSPYDLVYMDIVWVPKFAAAGWLTDLSDKVADTDLADFLEGDVAGGRYQGGLYRMPVRSDAGMLYYRKDLLDAAGFKPPETFTELMQISQALQKSGAVTWGYVWQGRQYEGAAAMFVEVLAGSGGFWIDPQTKAVGLDRPESVQAVKFLLDTINTGVSPRGVVTYQEEETRRLFQSGTVAFLRNWPYAWPLANAEDSSIRGKIAIKPMVHAVGAESAACQGGWGWGIAKTTRHPKEAWEAVQYLTSIQTQRKVTLSTGYLPSRRSLYNDPEIVRKYNFFPAMLNVIDNAALRPPIAQYAQASDILQRYLSSALTGQMTPERAMQAAANETRRLLGTA
ncbi:MULTISPECIES: ABC transporter substrate-binding protein [Trichocoleus]|uniref:ABC transporter substrate-binding protein n=1 Tax=Trichocoleus desertorum GB2-A4 TaxID=2933944 RepID=A0ABV0J5M1_9CYAN|nr:MULTISPECIES: ABC transporter substrate-binding protein [unclassified Trichocoleus]MBD1863785.1 ABC transporter substrate-binding protein [Trichocoleus sp. FACHB-46]MBD2121067.1 ABC transporter substrate-binding protein [Trichocoleus sp. FACHB-262]